MAVPFAICIHEGSALRRPRRDGDLCSPHPEPRAKTEHFNRSRSDRVDKQPGLRPGKVGRSMVREHRDCVFAISVACTARLVSICGESMEGVAVGSQNVGTLS
jgi:hypothetical protein